MKSLLSVLVLLSLCTSAYAQPDYNFLAGQAYVETQADWFEAGQQASAADSAKTEMLEARDAYLDAEMYTLAPTTTINAAHALAHQAQTHRSDGNSFLAYANSEYDKAISSAADGDTAYAAGNWYVAYNEFLIAQAEFELAEDRYRDARVEYEAAKAKYIEAKELLD